MYIFPALLQSLGEPSDLFVDIGSSLLFWSDIKLKRIEKSDLLGQERQAIVITDIFGPVAITVQGDSLFWADRSQNTIMRADKLTGKNARVVKSGVHHLSTLVSVDVTGTRSHNSLIPEVSPCLDMGCSHLCLLESNARVGRCSCPEGSGLVLSSDRETCGLPPTCKPAEFTCVSGSTRCIPLQWRCDGTVECSDHSGKTTHYPFSFIF